MSGRLQNPFEFACLAGIQFPLVYRYARSAIPCYHRCFRIPLLYHLPIEYRSLPNISWPRRGRTITIVAYTHAKSRVEYVEIAAILDGRNDRMPSHVSGVVVD